MTDAFDTFADAPIDLSQFDDDYARTEVRLSEALPPTIPDGQYSARIEEARLTRTARTNNPMVLWRLRILGPSHEGAAVTKSRVITHRTLGFLKEDLDLLGIHLPRISDLEMHLGECVGTEILIIKKTGTNGWADIYFRRGAAHAAAAGIDDNLPF